MKKIRCAAFFLILLLSFISCAAPKAQESESASDTAAPAETGMPAPTATDTPAPQKENTFSVDFDNRFGRGYQSIVETDEAYYYCAFCGSYVYYYDKAGDVFGVLCPKPECIHDEANAENKGCSGFINSHAKSLFCSDEKLFYVSTVNTSEYYGPALFGMNPDGTEREMIIKLDFGETQNYCWPQRFDLHRGKLYGWISYEKVEESEPIICFAVVSIDPATGDYRTLYEKTDCVRTIWPNLFFIDNYLYFSVPDAGPIMNSSSLEIFRWDMEKEELEEVYSSGETVIYGGMFDMWVESDGGIWLVPTVINPGKNPELLLISDGVLQTVFEFADYGSPHLIGGGVVNITSPEKELIIMDRDGTVLKRIKNDLSFLDDIDFSVDASGLSFDIYGDTNELFVVYVHLQFEHENGNPTYGSCLVRYDLTEEAPTAQLLAVSPWY